MSCPRARSLERRSASSMQHCRFEGIPSASVVYCPLVVVPDERFLAAAEPKGRHGSPARPQSHRLPI
jgi:hypothetical protein